MKTSHRTPKSDEKTQSPLPEPLAQELQGQIQELQHFVQDAATRHNTPAHEVEEGIWRRVLALGREAMKEFFYRAGEGDLGEQTELPNGRKVRRLPKLHTRPYQSVFGPFELSRAVYGTREKQKIEFVPLDQCLQLPESKFSYLLQDWDQRLAVENPFAQSSAILERILGFSQSVDSLERMNRKMAELVTPYWDSLEPPPASEEGELMVLSADGKGVVMRREKSDPASPAPIEESAPSPGPKPESKKMALLGTSYTVDRFERTPKQIVDALFRKPQSDPQPKRPSPQRKRVRASLTRSESGTMEPATEEIFGWLASESLERNPAEAKPLVVLMDGQTSLWNAAAFYLPKPAVEILDLLHVTPRLWEAAYLFHPKGSPAVVRFVRQRVRRILEGETSSVILGLRRMGTTHGLRGRKHEQLKEICQYFENHLSRMKYNEYLKAGYPIATGVIEGACRHLVKDRMERAGMMWVLDGAQAMLDLRSIHLSGNWDEFMVYRIKKETERLHPYLEANDNTARHVEANDNIAWQKVA